MELTRTHDITSDEKALVEILFQIMMEGGFERIDLLGNIMDSEGDPPDFAAGDELEQNYDIEGALGLYVPSEPKIILYEKGIAACSRDLGINAHVLRALVLIHELSHWAMHLLPYRDCRTVNPRWERYCSCEDIRIIKAAKIHEGWAQLLAWWVVDQAATAGDPIYRDAFLKLNERQSSAYHEYQEFLTEDRSILLKALVELRMLGTEDLGDRHWKVWLSCEHWRDYLTSLSASAPDEAQGVAQIQAAGMPLIKCNPQNIAFLRITTDEMQKWAIRLGRCREVFGKIQGSLSREVQDYAISKDLDVLEDIENLDSGLKLKYKGRLEQLERLKNAYYNS